MSMMRAPLLRSASRSKRTSSSVRPTLADVENLSRGLGTSRRGIGSRRVPHRLNEEERKSYELAKRKGFAVVKDGGWRKERKGSPLLNILRQRADALAQPLVWVDLAGRKRQSDAAEANANADADADAAAYRSHITPAPAMVCADLSPMRMADPAEWAAIHERCIAVVESSEHAALLPPPTLVPCAAPSEEECATMPIWQLPACVVQCAVTGRRHAGRAEELQEAGESAAPALAPCSVPLDLAVLTKVSKELAAKLAAELGTVLADTRRGRGGR